MEQEHVGSGEIPTDLAVIGAKLIDDSLVEVAHDFPFSVYRTVVLLVYHIMQELQFLLIASYCRIGQILKMPIGIAPSLSCHKCSDGCNSGEYIGVRVQAWSS
jgi:hypothetical protein